MAQFLWTPRQDGINKNSIDVSYKFGHGNYRLFSPFAYHSSYTIPVPGNEKMKSDSVEGIWQGLKIINSITDFSLFQGRAHKRKEETQGHQFGEQILDYVTARKQIYVPAYIYHVINNVFEKTKNDLETYLQSGDVFLFDVESNADIEDVSQPYSHAALLANILNLLRSSPLPFLKKKGYTYLSEDLHAIQKFRNNLRSRTEISLLDDVVTFAYLFSNNSLPEIKELHETYALRYIAQEKLVHDQKIFDRLNQYVYSEKTKEDYKILF